MHACCKSVTPKLYKTYDVPSKLCVRTNIALRKFYKQIKFVSRLEIMCAYSV